MSTLEWKKEYSRKLYARAKEARNAGRIAGREGKRHVDNPHHCDPKMLFHAWNRGMLEGRKEFLAR